MRTWLPLSMIGLALAGPAAGPANAQGVPTFDLRLFAERQAILDQTDQDLALQQDRLTREEELAEIERQQLASLEGLMDAMSLGSGDVAGTVAGLEAGQGAVEDVESAAASLYAPEDNNPAAARMFGDAREGIEELIIRAARHTYSLPGVSRAGLSLVQWRCLLQALIWQESRFQIGARSPVGAFGLTQIMPGTAGDLGIYPAYYDDPWLQVTGGARYLAQMLNMFDGNIIHALAAYNAGPGNVQNYGGVPPFAETQHYVVVIPQQYNSYLAAVGGIDALGTIDPVLLANASFSLSAHGAGVYGDYSLVSVRAAALRVQDIITRIGETEDLHEAIALNTYARAELAQLKAQLTYLTTKSSHILDSRGTHDGKKTLTEAEIDRVVRRFENQWGERHSPKLGHTSHLLMAFPVGTSGEEVRAITEAVCERFFQGEGSQFDYIAAIHQDRAHPHAHIVLNRRSKDGEMFFLGKDHHFNYDAFRVAMVEAAQVHGIRLEATRRLDRGVTTYRAEIDEVYKARDEGHPPVERQRTGADLAAALETVARNALTYRGLAAEASRSNFEDVAEALERPGALGTAVLVDRSADTGGCDSPEKCLEVIPAPTRQLKKLTISYQ